MGIDAYLKRVFPGTAEEYAQRAERAMLDGERLFVVTANPEILMHAQRDAQIEKLLTSPEAEVVPDGISVVKAMHILGLPAKERITGVDLAEKLLAAGPVEKAGVPPGRKGRGGLCPGRKAAGPVPGHDSGLS